MSIKDIYLSPNELDFYYRKCLKGVIDKNDLTKTQQAQLLQYAEKIKANCLTTIWGLIEVNEGTTLEHWAKHYVNYREVLTFINWINEPMIDYSNKSNTASQPKQSKTKAPSYATIGAFYYLLKELGIHRQGDLSNENFCKEMCTQYNFKYTRTILNNFFYSFSPNQSIKIRTQIFPIIDKKIADQIEVKLNKV